MATSSVWTKRGKSSDQLLVCWQMATASGAGDGNRGRVVVITGGAHGIGAAVASLASEQGYATVLLDRDRAGADEHSETLRAKGPDSLSIRCDVTNEHEVRTAFEQAQARFGPLTSLVTSAGIDRGGLVHELEPETWDAVMAVNLRGTFVACREAVRQMVDRGGAIVCLSSPFALVSADRVAAYASSKAGVCALVRSLAVDYARHGIRVNALLPGPTETELMWANVPSQDVVATRASVNREVPLGRLAHPDEVARAAVWLLSDAASYITGAQLACDGGLLARAAISV